MVEAEKEVDDGEREIFACDEGHGCDGFSLWFESVAPAEVRWRVEVRTYLLVGAVV